ncbi:MAG: 50S ribosomal protein L4 [Fimbriimonadaceae bacterium]|nr:50S ribosomal protein L4 [Fimbriimonadaceae bacterium]
MAELEIQGLKGKGGKHKLADKIANATASDTTLHRTVVAEEANARQGTQAAKTRSEVRGGGRKPYRQKKTGNARQGSIRSPHYAHGGMALAVKPRDYDKKVNRKERQSAILGALKAKIDAGDLIVTEGLAQATPKTKEAAAALKTLGVTDVKRVLVILPQYDEVTYKAFRNIANVTIKTAPSRIEEGKDATKTDTFSTRDLLVAHKIVMEKDALLRIEEVWAK